MNTKVKEELQALVDKYGGSVTPRQVVEFAENADTALHGCFDWEDTEAARKWRLHQARQLLRVAVIVLPEQKEPVRAFVSLYPDRKANTGYRSMVAVLNDDQMREQMLRDAMIELQTFRKKYSRLKELSGVFAEIDKLQTPLAEAV